MSQSTRRNSDWKSDFYKNGVPKEIIVIEDTPPPSSSEARHLNTSSSGYQVESAYLLGPPASSTRSKRLIKDSPKPAPQAEPHVKRRKKEIQTTQSKHINHNIYTCINKFLLFRFKWR
jgi:dual-specificity kinase